jgi:hypothetical protein
LEESAASILREEEVSLVQESGNTGESRLTPAS